MWQWLHQLKDIPWIVGGDFNMVENPQDKLGGTKHEWKGNKRFYWSSLKNKLSLLDLLEGRKNEYNPICFTWCNYQKGATRIYSRLDKFYINKDVFNFRRDRDGICTKVNPYTLSDHHLIQAVISWGNSTILPKLKKIVFI